MTRIHSTYFKITKNKSFEAQVGKWDNNGSIFYFAIDFSTHGRDHAGFNFIFSICGYHICFDFYDNRHWDTKNNCWEKCTEKCCCDD